MEPILVSGMHRSGTTWVGKILSADSHLAYISEPLNVLHRPGVMRVPTRHWYTYICDDHDGELLPALRETLQFKYHPWLELKSLRSLKDAGRMFANWRTFVRGRLRSLSPLVKDPFAVFSLAWFARQFNARVVIVVRHPAAVASSLKRLGWNFNFADLLNQPLLMRDWLEPYREDMQVQLTEQGDVIAQASLLWRMIYHVTGMLRENHPDFILVRHEDLSKDPVSGFQHLFEQLDLDYDRSVESLVLGASSSKNPSELALKDKYSIQLDSQANLENWKQRLDEGEIGRVRELTRHVASLYYADHDW
jgi:hypothetical protein